MAKGATAPIPPLITQGHAAGGVYLYVRVFSQPLAAIDDISCVFWLTAGLLAPLPPPFVFGMTMRLHNYAASAWSTVGLPYQPSG